MQHYEKTFVTAIVMELLEQTGWDQACGSTMQCGYYCNAYYEQQVWCVKRRSTQQLSKGISYFVIISLYITLNTVYFA